MSLPKLFNTITGGLLEPNGVTFGQVVAINTFDAILRGSDINEDMVIDSLRFLKSKLNNEDMHQLCEYFADVHDINYSMGEI